MGRKIPPFAALRAFEALARRGTLQATGQELGISASAISHQIKSLEGHLGIKLLLRHENRLQITEAGMAFARDLQETFDRIELAAQRTSSGRETARISINLFSSLAELWLVPLLGSFNAQHPDTLVSVVTNPEEIELSGSDIDLAIRYGGNAPSGHQTTELFPETIAPLCSPDYLAAHGPFMRAVDLLEHRLILCTCEPAEWQLWMERQGASMAKARHWLEVDTRAAALHAAQAGLGIAIGRRPFADLALARGELIEMFPDPVNTGMSYFLAVPDRSWSSGNVRAFHSWLCAAVRSGNPFAGAAGAGGQAVTGAP